MSMVSAQNFKRASIAIAAGLVFAIGGSYLLPHLRVSRDTQVVDIKDQKLIQQGQLVAQAADCVACHSTPNGSPFAGGLAMSTPMGTLYSTNITPDASTGIGAYDYADFERAVRHGIRKDGTPLYPAMPYVSYTVLTNEDTQALYAYFMSGVKAVEQKNEPAAIAWPMNMRWPLAWWQALFAHNRTFVAPQGASEEVARGAYLIEGAAHCGTCHTPRGIGMQEKVLSNDNAGHFLSGSDVTGSFAKSLRQEALGLAGWRKEDIIEFLRTGRNDRTAAFGSMAEVVEHSTQHFNEADLSAIAAYLQTLGGRASQAASVSKSEDLTTAKLYDNADERAGAQSYVAYCSACHRLDGQGTPKLFPALAGNAVVQTDNPTSIIQITLAGAAMAKTHAFDNRPSMPQLSKLDDQTVADTLTFIRTSWGNQAAAVTAKQVAQVRAQLAKQPLNKEPTQNKDVAAGEALALDRAKGNCLACHTLKGGDAASSVGRELVDMKRKFPNRADLVEILNDEPSRNAVAPMPPFGRNHVLTPTEIDQIIDFLYTL